MPNGSNDSNNKHWYLPWSPTYGKTSSNVSNLGLSAVVSVGPIEFGIFFVFFISLKHSFARKSTTRATWYKSFALSNCSVSNTTIYSTLLTRCYRNAIDIDIVNIDLLSGFIKHYSLSKIEQEIFYEFSVNEIQLLCVFSNTVSRDKLLIL